MGMSGYLEPVVRMDRVQERIAASISIARIGDRFPATRAIKCPHGHLASLANLELGPIRYRPDRLACRSFTISKTGWFSKKGSR